MRGSPCRALERCVCYLLVVTFIGLLGFPSTPRLPALVAFVLLLVQLLGASHSLRVG